MFGVEEIALASMHVRDLEVSTCFYLPIRS